MTKEEIIKMYEPHPNKAEISVISAMMDEYAKQQAIEFAQHMFQNVWKMNDMNPSPFVSNDQLYNQFIESQNK
jgi:hypothetical protein